MLALSLATAGVAAAATTPEFKPVPAKKKFTGKGAGMKLVSGDVELYCTSSAAKGEITSARTVGGIVLAYTGCEASITGGESWCPIKSVGAKTDEIVTEALKGELGTAASKEAPSEVAISLKPENSHLRWAHIAGNCAVVEGWMEGQVGAEIKLIGKKQTTNTLAIDTEGRLHKITLDSGEAFTRWFEWSDVGVPWENSQTLTFEEAVEVT
jgi:hypothetical protein